MEMASDTTIAVIIITIAVITSIENTIVLVISV